MGFVSRGAQSVLRALEIIWSAVVLGILGHFLHVLNSAGVSKDGRIIYGVVVASISTLFALIFVGPFLYSFSAFPFDFAFFIMWLVLFCLLITRTGTHTCGSPWFYNYWGYYWGGWWWTPFNGVVNSGCGAWRTALGFSFLAMITFLATAIIGAYGVSRHWATTRKDRRAGTAATTGPQTTQVGGPAPAGGVVGNTGTGTGTAAGTGTAPATHTTQPATYV